MRVADSWTTWCIVWKKWTGAGYVSASEILLNFFESEKWMQRRNETLELNENLHGEGFISSKTLICMYTAISTIFLFGQVHELQNHTLPGQTFLKWHLWMCQSHFGKGGGSHKMLVAVGVTFVSQSYICKVESRMYPTGQARLFLGLSYVG